MLKNLIIWSFIIIILVTVFSNFGPHHAQSNQLSFSQFLEQVNQGSISSVVFEENKMSGIDKSNRHVYANVPLPTQTPPELVKDLLHKGIDISAKVPEQQSLLMRILINWFPMLLFIAVWIFFLRQMQGGG